jgi:bifunctional UDP-N-acetylglucosamine pyrophosphorylase / glucosamine-1-phosphate N-acetyltransferase
MALAIKVVILAAGLGTRMRSRMAKVLHRAGGKALVEHVVDTALELTPSGNIYVVVGHQADRVKALLAPRGVQFVTQTEQKGTGHAVLSCREAAGGEDADVLVLYGDCPLLAAGTLKRLIACRQETDAAVVAVTAFFDDPTGYGRILRDANGQAYQVMEEKPATPEQRKIKEINAGIYCYRGMHLWRHLDDIQPTNPAKEYYLTDMIEILHKAGLRVETFQVPDPGELMGINNRVELAVADRIIRERKVRQLMEDGVTIVKPETVTIDSQVRIGSDTIVESFAQILGDTIIGEDCHIGACAIISDSTLADNVEVGPFTIINTSRVETEAVVGPFARLRLENTVEQGAHVGNFVELKKTRLGAGAKASHLAYLGDSDIGSKVNVGAGTITCNYDGKKKSRTVMGEGAFIGSNSTLVAPVEIGPGSYIAAASVITDAVPADALAIGRGRQVNKEGWAKKRREG